MNAQNAIGVGAILINGLLACGPAAAQAEDESVIIVTAAGVPQDRDESGQAISVIDAATIESRQARSVADLLLQLPSTRSNSNGNLGSVTGVTLRGSENGQTLVLLDGVRINDPSSTSDAVDFGGLLVGNIRRIEVMRGSNSVPFGSEAIGGVIDISTRDASDPDGLTLHGTGEGGFANTAQGTLDAGWRAGDLRLDAGIAGLRTDGISSASPQFGASEKDGLENITAHLGAVVPLSGDVSLDLRGYVIDARLDYDSFFSTPADSADTSAFQQATGFAGITISTLQDRLRNRFSFTYLANGRDYRFAPDSPPDFGYRGNSWRFDYQGRADLGQAADVLFGYSHEAPEYRFFGFGSDAQEQANTDSVFALATLRPAESLALTGGLRRDEHSQFGGVTTLGFNANLGLPDGRTRIRAAYGEGFRTPSLYQLFDSYSGNADLAPEQSESIDFGVDHRFAGGVGTLSLTVFTRTTRNQIDYDLDTSRYGNLARTRARGVELEAQFDLGQGTRLAAAYSLVDARNRSPGSALFDQHLARRPVHGASVSLNKDWQAGPSLGFTARMASRAVDPGTADGLDGYVLFDLRASYPVGDHAQIYGRIENLFDADHVTAYGYSSFPRAAYGGIRFTL